MTEVSAMECAVIYNLSSSLSNGSVSAGDAGNGTDSSGFSLSLSWIQVVLPVVCIIGISGNILNLLVLTRKRLYSPMQTLERSANIGLTGLALSDLLFSIVALPYPFLVNFPPRVAAAYGFVLYYRYYSIAFFNLCLMISMYLVMLLAVERYLVTYSPQRAKTLMQPCATVSLVAAVYVLCCGATVPYFLNMRVVACVDATGRDFYELRQRWAETSTQHTWLTAYMTWCWPCVAVFGPLLVLLVCNLRLVLTLRSSLLLQCRCPSNARQKLHSYRVTLLLIIIVFMAIVLITPAELLKLINPYKTWGPVGFVIADVANVLQATNFAFNFMLYCAVDRRFRIIVKELLTAPCCDQGAGMKTVEIPLRYGLRKHGNSNRTLTFKICKTSTKSSISKKKLYMIAPPPPPPP